MNHILITGGAGFIGSSLVDKLIENGFRVSVIDNFDEFYPREVKEKNIAKHLNNPSFKLYDVDIRNLEALKQISHDDFDAIVHLAAKAGVRPSIENPIEYQEVNVRGTQNMLEMARERGIEQFVFASSSSVYGINSNVPWNEDDHVLMPISPYASSKVSGELLGHVYSHLYNIRFIALRFFTVYGPRQRPDLAIHKFVKLIQANENIPVFGDGSTRRDYTYISDIVEAIYAGIHYKESMYEIINVGNNNTISLINLIHEIEKSLHKEARIEWKPNQPGDVPQTWANIYKAQNILKYNPEFSISDGLNNFVNWLNNN